VRFEIMADTFKRYASGRPTHTAIATMHDIMAAQGLTAADLSSIEVRIPTLERRLLSRSLTRNIDFEYNIAVAAMDGQIAWEQYTQERQSDPVLIDLCSRVTTVGDPEFDAIKRANVGANPSQVVLRTWDGRAFAGRMIFPPGHPNNPLNPGELHAKFAHWAGPVIGAEQADRLAALIGDLDQVEDVRAVGDLLQVPATRLAPA